MRIEVQLFAVCRDRAQTNRLEIDIPNDSIGLAEFKAALEAACPPLGPLLPITRVAVNQSFADPDTRICPGDEVALIPPVSGGSGLGPFELRQTPLNLAEVEQAVAAGGAGAVVSFAGTVRDRTGEHEVIALDYEAYPEMAVAFLRQIGASIAEQWPGTKAAIIHRTGRVEVGETSVVIAVSNPHRAEAFDACRFAIESLKKDVPIWKKELRKDGSVWVGVGS